MIRKCCTYFPYYALSGVHSLAACKPIANLQSKSFGDSLLRSEILDWRREHVFGWVVGSGGGGGGVTAKRVGAWEWAVGRWEGGLDGH